MKNKVLSIISGLLIVSGVVFNVSVSSNNGKNLSNISLAEIEALSGEWVDRTMVGNFEEDQSGVMSCGGIVKRWNDCKSSCNNQSCTYVLCKTN
jgi:hypothetical protein